MARRSARLLTVLCALAAAAPGSAQDVPPPDPAESDSTIVVTGEAAPPPTRDDVYDQAQALSRVGRYQMYEEALPRFQAPLCPGVTGLRRDYAAAIADRIRTNATRLEIPVAAVDCSPNLVVAFVDDGRSLLEALGRDHPDLFTKVAESERQEILDGTAPVRVWNNIASVWVGNGPPPAGWPRQKASVRGQMDRGFMPERKDIVFSVVAFERDAVIGMSLTQLADYATMRGLTHTRPAGGSEPMATILALFADDTREPNELTDFDVGYLRSLYWWKPNLSAASKLLGVRSRAREEAGRPAAP
jgi:hypothetical protein